MVFELIYNQVVINIKRPEFRLSFAFYQLNRNKFSMSLFIMLVSAKFFIIDTK